MAKHSLEFTEVIDYLLVNVEANEICMKFDSVDIKDNSEKWEYVKNAMKSMSKSYRIFKHIPFSFVRE